MNNSFVQKIRSEIPEEVKFYGIEPQNSARAAMFEMRTKDGRRKAFSYSHITQADYEPDGSIIIQVLDVTITVKGRSLEDVFGYLVANRIKYIQEDFSGMDSEDSKLFIESIEIVPRTFSVANDNEI
jgi:hypothetical protein